MTIQRESIWAQVKPHTWKYRPRTATITGILWHSTRGGQWYDGNTELGAFINWERSPDNKARQNLFPDYGGMASYGIGPNRIVEVMPDGYIPAWSSHPSDEHVISVEIAQSNLGQTIEPETIATCVVFAKEMSQRYGFPLTRVYPVNDWTWSGMAGHEDTVQGKAQGKSDPGAAFWEPFMAALEGDAMTPEERVELDNLKIAIFAGSEEGDLDRLTRVIKANYRMDEIAAGRAQSVSDRATSAVVLSKRALAIASAIAVAGGAFGAAATQVLGG